MSNEKLKIRDNVELILTDKDGNIKHSEPGFSCTIIKRGNEAIASCHKEDKANAKGNIKRRD